MNVWHLEVYGGGCGIRVGSRESIIREEGTNNVRSLRPATVEECDWVRAMGGYVPAGAVEAIKTEIRRETEMITNKFDCTIHGVGASCCLECSQNRAAELDSARKRIANLEVENAELAKCNKQDGMVGKQQKMIEIQKEEFKKLRSEIERLKLALIEENSVKKVNPVDAFATMGAVGMMQEEIKRLEGELDKVTRGNLNAQRVAHDVLNLLLEAK